jgi:hypothetical protein
MEDVPMEELDFDEPTEEPDFSECGCGHPNARPPCSWCEAGHVLTKGQLRAQRRAERIKEGLDDVWDWI